MPTAHTPAPRPFLIVKPAQPSYWKGIERLRLVPSYVASTGGEELTPETAVQRLADAGLQCERVPGELLHILGGATRFNVDGIRGYEHAFAIFREREGEGLTVTVAASRAHEEELTTVSTLSEAVAAVLGTYMRRGVRCGAG